MSKLEKQILAVTRQLRTVVDQVSDGVLIVGGDLGASGGPEVVFANRSFGELCGCTAVDLVGRPLEEVFPDRHVGAILAFLGGVTTVSGSPFPSPLETSLCGCRVAVYEGNASVTLDGEGRPANYTLTLARPSSAEVAAGAGREASVGKSNELLHDEEEGDRVGELAPAAAGEMNEVDPQRSGPDDILDLSRMESLALVAGGIAHDFNNVLTTILANLSLAIPLVEKEKDLGSYIRQAAVASEGAKGLTKKLLSFARGGKPKKELIDLGALVVEAIELSSYGSNVRCQKKVASELFAVEADPVQLIQILNNLLINAWQAMPGGGVVQVSLENLVLEMGLKEDEEELMEELSASHYVVISVRDRGCGIPEGKLTQIFEPFYTTKKNGSGLGLATCATVAREHGGLIRVRSKIGAGTEFRIYLPSDGSLASAIPKKEEVGGKVPVVSKGHRCPVLVVDDQRAVLDVACLILKKLGYEVHSASSGQEAVELVGQLGRREQRLGAVLMDMTLPGGMSGREATAEILRQDPSARVVAMSGFFDDDAKESLRVQGFCGVLPKPFTIESLSRVMDEAVEEGTREVADEPGGGQARVA